MRHLIDVETTDGLVTINPERIESIRPSIDKSRPDLLCIRMASGYQFITAETDICATWASALTMTNGDPLPAQHG